MTDPYSISITTVRDVVYVGIAGDFDLAAVSAFGEHISTHLHQPDVYAVAVELSATNFLDSTGIGALVSAKNLAEAVGKDFWVQGANGRVADVLDLTGLAGPLSRQHSEGPLPI